MKRLALLCLGCIILASFLVGNVKAYTWYDEDFGEASISGSWYIGIGEYATNTLKLGERCIVWQEATAKGSMYVYGIASSNGPVTGSIYWYTRGNLAAGGTGDFKASIKIKFQAYDVTANALYEKVILDKGAAWSDEGTWRWDSMSIPLYSGHKFKLSIYAEVYAKAYGIGASVADFGGIWWADSKIEWGYIDVPNISWLPPVTVTVQVPQAPPEGVAVYVDNIYYRAYAATPVRVKFETGYHTIQVEKSFVKEEWTPDTYFIYVFDRWSDGSTANPRTVYLSADTTFTACYRRLPYGIV
jgi:hypothetical protein